MLKKILLVVLGLVVLLVLVGLLLSQHYAVSRTASIKADKARIHALAGDLKRWPEWAPWLDEDPTIKTTLGDKTTGVGASQTWTGKEGGGRLTFTKCDPNDGVAYDMVFIMGDKEVPAKGWMTYAPRGDMVDVTWAMEGEMQMPVVGGYFALFSGPMIGSMFDKGLAKLKARAEAP